MTLAMGRDRGGGFLGWFKSIFGHRAGEPDWKEKMQMIITMIREQQEKLDLISFRMQNRAEELFDRIVEQYKKANRKDVADDERKTLLNMARTFAEEIREIKAILRAIGFTKVSLEKVVQRLETVKDVKDFQDSIVPITSLIKGIKQEISPIFPSIGSALDEIHRSISELAFQTSAGIHSLPTGNLTPGESEDVEKILKEAWQAATESVEKKIPEPTRVVGMKIKSTNPAMKTVAKKPVAKSKPVDVVVEANKKHDSSEKDSVTEVSEVEEAIKLPVPRLSMAKLEQLVLDEIKINRGRFNVDEFARKYGIDKDRVYDALQSLVRKGKIRVARK